MANFDGRVVFDGRSTEGRGENFGRFGCDFFANEPLDFAGVEGRGPDGPRPKLGLGPLAPALANDAVGFADNAGRESERGMNFGLTGGALVLA